MLEVNVERLPSFMIGEERGFERGLKQIAHEKAIAFEKGIAQGIEHGIAQGIEQGSHKKAVTIAQQLFQLNLSVAEIAQITGLTTEELQHLCQK